MGGVNSIDSSEDSSAATGSWNYSEELREAGVSCTHTTQPVSSFDEPSTAGENQQRSKVSYLSALFDAVQSFGSQVGRFRSPGLYDDAKDTTTSNFINSAVQPENNTWNHRFSDGSTLLTRKVRSGDLAAVSEILKQPGLDLNLPERPPVEFRECQKPPLMVAVQTGSLEMVQLLLDAGADVNVSDETGITALYQAVELGFTEIARLLMNRKADLRRRRSQCDPLYAAFSRGNLEMASLLIKAGCSMNQEGDCPSILRLAIEQKNEDLCFLLFQSGADKSGERDHLDPLFLTACRFGLPRVAEDFIKDGCDVNMRSANGTIALACAVNMFNYQYERSLMFREEFHGFTDEDLLSFEQKRLLHTRISLVQLLCEKGCKLNTRCETMLEQGRPVTPLYLALQNFNLPCAVALILHGALWDNTCQKALLHCHSYNSSQQTSSSGINVVIRQFLPIIVDMLSHKDRMLFWKASDCKSALYVPSLKSCCREVIQRQLFLHEFTCPDEHVSALTLIQSLKLPAILRDYLSFTDSYQKVFDYLKDCRFAS